MQDFMMHERILQNVPALDVKFTSNTVFAKKIVEATEA